MLEEFTPLLDAGDYAKVRAVAYDVVLNGYELGGGSIRIHEKDLQAKMFSVLGVSEEEQQIKFSHLLDAFRFGAPPHGGLALGLDRIAMLKYGMPDLRDFFNADVRWMNHYGFRPLDLPTLFGGLSS